MSVFKTKNKKKEAVVRIVVATSIILLVTTIIAAMCNSVKPVVNKQALLEQPVLSAESEELLRQEEDRATLAAMQEAAKQKQEELEKKRTIALKIKELGVVPISDFSQWKLLENEWFVRGIKTRFITTSTDPTTETQVIDLTSCHLEYTIKYTGKRKKLLTRILIEVFDEELKFMFPSVVDISGADAGLAYVRTGGYTIGEQKPTYCRITFGQVAIVKYKNDYPQY